MIDYPPRMDLARTPTPIERLERFEKSRGLPGELWVKRDDLTGLGLSGNKIRKLEFLLADARAKGATAVVTCGGVQSNHARATALAAAQLGLKCTLILRKVDDSVPELAGNLLLDRLAGARVRWVTRAEYSARREALLDEEVRRFEAAGERGYAITEGGSDAVGSWGYVRALEEILAQDSRWDAIGFATGSGGTAAGLFHGRSLLRSRIPIVGFCVCDDAAFFERKVSGIVEKMGTPPEGLRFVDRYKGPGYAVPDEPTLEVIAQAARTTGLLLDPVYTGKAFLGTVEEIKKGTFGPAPRVLFIHTGGIFGTLAQAGAFTRVVQES
ncbi:MAG: D-cysteine desulfhydrase family protein [Planctomycetota bacterium]